MGRTDRVLFTSVPIWFFLFTALLWVGLLYVQLFLLSCVFCGGLWRCLADYNVWNLSFPAFLINGTCMIRAVHYRDEIQAVNLINQRLKMPHYNPALQYPEIRLTIPPNEVQGLYQYILFFQRIDWHNWNWMLQLTSTKGTTPQPASSSHRKNITMMVVVSRVITQLLQIST